MANTSTIQLNVNVFGPSGAPAFAETISESNAAAPVSIQMAYPFATGDNTILVPAGATQLIIWGITGTVKLKQSAGDAGVPLGTTLSSKFPVTTSVLLNATAGALGNLAFV